MANNQRKPKHSCFRCDKLIQHPDIHIRTCKKAIENVDFVICKICEKRFTALYTHCLKHKITSLEYTEKYGGLLMCSETEKRVSERNKATQKKHNYRNALKEEGKIEELANFNKKVGEQVSKTIMASPELRQIRSDNLGRLNKTEQFREKASKTAIKTSARKDILEERTLRLDNWRKNNPEKMQEILSNMHFLQTSRPEKHLFKTVCALFPHLNFKNNQRLYNGVLFDFNVSKRKQLDIFSKENKIIIEFDDHFHFKNIKKWNQLEMVQKKDAALNSLSNEYCIIRISLDQFSYRKDAYGFKPECVEKLKEILGQHKPGLFLIGNFYGQNQVG